MPDIKFSQLDQLDIAVTADYIPIIDASDVTMGANGTNKTISLDNLANSIFNLSGTVEFDASQITTGTISSDRLPSYVDDVLEYSSLINFPVTGQTGKIYVALDTNKTYRWSGSAYIEISPSLVVSVNGYTDAVVLTKSDIGLSNVDNTSDLNKPISTATQTALNGKQPTGDYATGGGTATGTNTGDQTITLTGAVTGSGTGSFATTLADDVVTLGKMANVATSTVFYRKTSGTGDPEVQTLATLKTDLGLSGSNSGDQDLSGLVAKLTPSEYTVTNGPAVPVKTFDASTATIDDVYKVLATLIQTLKDRQII